MPKEKFSEWENVELDLSEKGGEKPEEINSLAAEMFSPAKTKKESNRSFLTLIILIITLFFIIMLSSFFYGWLFNKKILPKTVEYIFNQEFSLRVGQEALMANSSGKEGFYLVSIVDDSRCPTDRFCLWSGEILVELDFYQGDKITKKYLSSIGLVGDGYQRGVFSTRKIIAKGLSLKDGFLIITKALPVRKNTKEISEKNYEVFFKVTKLPFDP